MRTLQFTIAYVGTRYAGWQVQRSRPHTAHRTQQPTIQGVLERALATVLRERVRVVGSGRTDAGVHAHAQVAHLKTRSPIACERLLRSVNALLPHDIAVLSAAEVSGRFHARFQARRKSYRYRIFTGPVVPPFIRPYVHHVRHPLNLPLMRREAASLAGRHDFRGFARGSGQGRASTTRRLEAIAIRRAGPELQLDISGNGFLHTMVRSIAGTLIDVGRGRLPEGTVRRILRTRDRRLAGTTAPAKGLMLMHVEYEQ